MSASKQTIAEYDFDMDAMGFGDFIVNQMAVQSDNEIVVCVIDADGRSAVSAKFVRTELSDGSHTTELIIKFDE